MKVKDSRHDPHCANNPLVKTKPSIRFYADARRVTVDGVALGSSCVMYRKCPMFTDRQHRALQVMAWQMMAQRESRKRVIREQEEAGDVLDLKKSISIR